ncbi:MAG: FAD-binding oxidoreductase [Frankiales bacterium]|nr:FAD-binding oxidoreductase [Frankiales bacterium]
MAMILEAVGEGTDVGPGGEAVGADAVVIGAGVIGAAIALELSRGGRRVIVVDSRRGPGQGSTSASSAVIRFNYSTWDGVALSWEAKHAWETWREHLGAADGEPLARFRRTGFLMLDSPVSDNARSAALFDRAGIPYELWDAATLRQRLPAMDPARFWPPKALTDPAFWETGEGELGALFCPDGGYVDDPQLAAVNLADAAARAGTTFRFGRRVVEVLRNGDRVGDERDDKRVGGVRLDDGSTVTAPVVVNAGGPWSTSINALAGVGDDFAVAVRPMRQEVHQVAAPADYRRPGEPTEPGPVVGDLDLGVYLRPAAADELLVGGTEPECDPLEWLDDADDADLNPTAAVFERQVTRAARRLPDLRVPGAVRGVAGVYDVAADWTPIYDRTALPGYYVAMATSGNQFKNAPAVGELMAALIQATESAAAEAAPAAGVASATDAKPAALVWIGPRTGLAIDTAAFSRRRTPSATSGTRRPAPSWADHKAMAG